MTDSRDQLIFEKTHAGRQGYSVPAHDVPPTPVERALPADLVRGPIDGFPELSENNLVRHYTRLSTWNYGVDTGMYPLGSCTMKYNPKINEAAARLGGFGGLHPDDARGRLAGRAQGDVRAAADARRDHRAAVGDAAAGGRRARRADRHDDDPQAARGSGRPPAVARPDSRLGARHEPRQRRTSAGTRCARSDRARRKPVDSTRWPRR